MMYFYLSVYERISLVSPHSKPFLYKTLEIPDAFRNWMNIYMALESSVPLSGETLHSVSTYLMDNWLVYEYYGQVILYGKENVFLVQFNVLKSCRRDRGGSGNCLCVLCTNTLMSF